MKKALIVLTMVICVVIMVILWNNPNGRNSSFVNQGTTLSAEKPPVTEKDQTDIEGNEQNGLTFDNPEAVKEYLFDYGEKMGYDVEKYPEKFFEIVVKDPTALEYVLDYPAKVGSDIDYTIDYVANGSVPHFLQWDTRWGYHEFKNGVVGLDGCGATCLSMAAVYLTNDTSLTPDKISDYAANNGYFVNGSGISWDFFSKGVNHYGLSSRGVSTTESSLKSALERGNPVVASVREGDFTKKGHYILIADYRDGNFVVNDPNSLVNSQRLWDWETLKPQIKNMWEIYK